VDWLRRGNIAASMYVGDADTPGVDDFVQSQLGGPKDCLMNILLSFCGVALQYWL